MVWGLGLRVSLGLRASGSRFTLWGLGFRVFWAWIDRRVEPGPSREGRGSGGKGGRGEGGRGRGGLLVGGAFADDLEGGACSHNLYTSGPRPRRIIEPFRRGLL